MMRPTEPEASNAYRLNVGMVLLNGEGNVFAGQRIDVPQENWQMPQGGVDEGESLEEAASRELREEIGTDAFKLFRESQHWHVYDFPPNAFNTASSWWKGQYKGQQQRWFLYRFQGNDEDICLETAHPEFKAWKWMAPGLLLQEVVSFKQPIYRAVFEEFFPTIS